MFSLPLAFTTPIVLTGLALLAGIWFLLRLVPPRPKEVTFPPTRLLLDSPNREETPARTPWWLTLLRLLLAALIIIALAGPIWRPLDAGTAADGPLAVVVDNGWASASHWEEVVFTAGGLIEAAENRNRSVALIATADGQAQTFEPVSAADARDRLRALEPRPWPADRGSLAAGFGEVSDLVGEVIWLADGIAGQNDSGFLQALSQLPEGVPIAVYEPGGSGAMALVETANDADRLTARVVRAAPGPAQSGALSAVDERGRPIGSASFAFAADETAAEASFELPIELRNQIARLELTEKADAGSVFFLDERWRRRTVGLLAGSGFDAAQPLLSPIHYLSQALVPFADVRIPRETEIGSASKELIDQNVSVIMLADIGTLVGDGAEQLQSWVEDGGMLVRFAGPRLAESASGLLPVRLRSGERTLGGNLSWEEPQPIGQFSEGTPFAGLVAADDVSVTRQVLAEPDVDLPDKTWASLADGTPLVTADQVGRGWIVLFHVTADTTWSNLPLSGTFVEMLRKIIAFSNAAGATTQGTDDQEASLPPLRTLNGFGEIGPPTRDARGIFESQLPTLVANAENPPGLYGTEEGFRALNLFHNDRVPQVLDAGDVMERADRREYAASEPLDLTPWLFLIALLLLLADTIVMIFVRGLPKIPSLRTGAASIVAGVLVVGTLLPIDRAQAQSETDGDVQALIDSALKTRLAYVMTGVAPVDEKARNGLMGLSLYLAERTALEPGPPIGVNLDDDELAFFPLLYWPVSADSPEPSERSLARIDGFMKSGGTVIFDTADQFAGAGSDGFSTTPEGQKLREILVKLNVPPLEPVPGDHVLTKAFYLLQDFPGRWTGSPLWVERLQAAEQGDRPVRAGDGVTPLMITGNDFAGAWAITETGEYLFPTVPDNARQREMAFRVGVNIVMYTLTGNYKADQVHVPALLERLGQ